MAADLLLVHGSMLGASCWEATIEELAGLGTEAAAFDLPGRGGPATPGQGQAPGLLQRPGQEAGAVLGGHLGSRHPGDLRAGSRRARGRQPCDPQDVVASRWLSSLEPDGSAVQAIRSRLTPQPAGPLFEPWNLPAGSLDGLPVTYIWPGEDRQNTERRPTAASD